MKEGNLCIQKKNLTKKKQKYYAIKEGKGVKNKIVRTWTECKELVLGYPSIYKSFYTEEDLQQKQ